ncbi:VOC family protein [Halovulum sp. GXIMD14793]
MPQLHHVQLAMPPGGEDRARAFYIGLLGLPEVAKPPELAKRGGCWFESGELRLHIGVQTDGFQPATKAHPGLMFEDLTPLEVRFREAGTPMTFDAGYPCFRRAYVSDPFGNRIELMQAI